MYGIAETQEKWGFHLGDRVKFVALTDPDDGVAYGQEGVICSLDNDYDYYNVGVEWNEECERYHDCAGKCNNHRGWWVPYEDLVKVDLDIGEIEASEFDLGMLFDTTS